MNNLDVLYEDNHIIVVCKDVNIPTQEDSSHDIDLLNMIKNYIKIKYKKPGNVYIGMVHRLDRPVSGVLVFARSSKAASRLNKQILENKFSKVYLAVVHGIIKNDYGRLEDNILKMDNGNSIISPKGKKAVLDYQVIKRDYDNDLTLVSIKLETGRHHQIRVQFKNFGHPLYGDQRYGKLDNKQIALHAWSLSFYHPISKELISFNKLPDLDRDGFIYFKKELEEYGKK